MALQLPDSRVVSTLTRRLIELLIAFAFCAGPHLCAQGQEAQGSGSNDSWTATGETSLGDAGQSRSLESHMKYDNRTVDKHRMELLGPNGQYLPDSETDTETIQVNATTTRTVERTYKWDVNGRRNLTTVTEEESHGSSDGNAHLVRTTSFSDGNGNLQVTQREVTDTARTSPNAEEKNTTFYMVDGNGRLAPTSRTQEQRTRTDERTVEVTQTMLRPFSTGQWEVGEVRKSTIQDDGKTKTSEESVSQSSLNGRLSEVSRTVSKETKDAEGEQSNSVETYSISAPGSAPDGKLQLNTRVTTVQKQEPGGKIIEERVEQPDPNNPNGNPQAVTKTKYSVQYASSGSQQKQSTEVRDLNGNWNVVAFGTKKTDKVPAEQEQNTPTH